MTSNQLAVGRENIRNANWTTKKWYDKHPQYQRPNYVDSAECYRPASREQPGTVSHLIPGYAGYVPRSKFSMAVTYGRMTDGMVRPPPNLEDEPGRFPKISAGLPATNTEYLPPGYAGHVPNAQFEYSKTYPKVTRESLARRKEAQRRHQQEAEQYVKNSMMNKSMAKPRRRLRKKGRLGATSKPNRTTRPRPAQCY